MGIRLLLLAAFGAVLLSACGGDDAQQTTGDSASAAAPAVQPSGLPAAAPAAREASRIDRLTRQQAGFTTTDTMTVCSARERFQTPAGERWLHLDLVVKARPPAQPTTDYVYAEAVITSDSAGQQYVTADTFDIWLKDDGPYRLLQATGVRTPETRGAHGSWSARTQTAGPNAGPLSVQYPCE